MLTNVNAKPAKLKGICWIYRQCNSSGMRNFKGRDMVDSVHNEKLTLARQLARLKLSQTPQYKFIPVPDSVLDKEAQKYMKLSVQELKKELKEIPNMLSGTAKTKDGWELMGFHLSKEQKAAASKNINNINTNLSKRYKNKKAPKADTLELMKEVEASREQEKVEKMSPQERKNYIAQKIWKAKDNKDVDGMANALYEFYDYDCKDIDKKLGIDAFKKALTKYTGADALSNYIHKKADDGDPNNLTGLERFLSVLDGVSETGESFVGTQGLTMGVAFGGANKVPVLGKVIQTGFAAQGSEMTYNGGKEIINGKTEDEVRQGASEGSMGLLMFSGGLKSIEGGYKKISGLKADKKAGFEAPKSEIGEVKANEVPVDGKKEGTAVHKDAPARAAHRVPKTRTELKEKLNKVETTGQQKTNDNNQINIPKGKFRAPSSKFAETDEAFRNIVRNSNHEFLALNQKNGDEFIKAAFDLIKDKIGLDDAPIKLNINNNLNNFDQEAATLNLNRNWKGGDKAELMGAIAHEFDHFLQNKEMYVNHLLEGRQRVDIDGHLESWLIDNIEKYIDNHNEFYINKADSYLESFKNYIQPETNRSAYQDQPVEAEAHRRGDIVRDEYKSLVTNTSPRQAEAPKSEIVEIKADEVPVDAKKVSDGTVVKNNAPIATPAPAVATHKAPKLKYVKPEIKKVEFTTKDDIAASGAVKENIPKIQTQEDLEKYLKSFKDKDGNTVFSGDNIADMVWYADTPECVNAYAGFTKQLVEFKDKDGNLAFSGDNISNMAFNLNTPELANLKAGMAKQFLEIKDKDGNPVFSGGNIMLMVDSANTPELSNAKYGVAKEIPAKTNLSKEKITEIIIKTNESNAELAKALMYHPNLDKNNIPKILQSLIIRDEGANKGKVDTNKVKRYTALLKKPLISDFVTTQLNNGLDIDTAAFLAKTKTKLNAEAVKESNPVENSFASTSQYSASQEELHNTLTSIGVSDKDASYIVKACTIDGKIEANRQTAAIDMFNKGVATNKISEAINLATINGKFEPKVVDDFVKLQNNGLNPLLEKNLAILNNISGPEVAVRFNPKVKNQLKAMISKLPEEQNTKLMQKGIDLNSISEKFDSKIVKTADNVPQKVKVVSGLRAKQNIKGFERLVIDQFNPDEKIWRNEEATKKWAEDKYESIKSADYDSQSYPDVNPIRQKLIKEWSDYLDNESTIKDDACAKILVMDGLTRNLLPENAEKPPELDKQILKDILAESVNNQSKISLSTDYVSRMRKKAMKNSVSEDVDMDGFKGKWYTVPQTDKNSLDYGQNVEKVQSFSDGTNWCIRTYMADSYVPKGNMHFFVDENGLTQICVREDPPGTVYEIQKRQQNATVPIPQINLVKDFLSKRNLTPGTDCKSGIDNAVKAKPLFDNLRTDFREKLANGDTKAILEKMGITVNVAHDGTYEISNYSPEIKGEGATFTLSDLGISEDVLLENVSKIEGTGNFKNSNATKLPKMQHIGQFIFDESNISDIRKMKEINGYKINWE